MRCLYLYQSGSQCPVEAIEASEFCADHYSNPDSEGAEAANNIPWVYRLTAFLLLLIFLAKAYQTLLRWMGR